MNMQGGLFATIASAIAVLFSGYSLWDTSLAQSDLTVFVPPVIYYAGHEQNSNIEALRVPVTIANDGAQTGTVLSLTLTVTDKAGRVKRFYSASVVPPAGTPVPFSPIVLSGHSSASLILLFYTRGAAEKVEQIVQAPGVYAFKLALDEAQRQSKGVLALIPGAQATTLSFERELPAFDARADMALYAPDWHTTVSGQPQ